MLPTPALPCVALPGFAFSHAMSSFKSFAGMSFLATTISEKLASKATGSKSFTTSYLKIVQSTIGNMRVPEAQADACSRQEPHGRPGRRQCCRSLRPRFQ